MMRKGEYLLNKLEVSSTMVLEYYFPMIRNGTY
jgi:hypothetical protein